MPSLTHITVDWPTYEEIANEYNGSLWKTVSPMEMKLRDSCFQWWRRYLWSFREHFPDAHLLVGTRPSMDPRLGDLLQKYGAEPFPVPGFQHGVALNALAAELKRRGVEILVHTEPDCLFNGHAWLDNLLAPLESSADMTSNWNETIHLHITASAWRVAAIPPCGFCPQPRTRAQWADPFMDQLVFKIGQALPRLSRLYPAADDATFYTTLTDVVHNWDTGGSAWFELAAKGRACFAPRAPDFVHLWVGREAPPSARIKQCQGHPWLVRYLQDF